MSKLGCTCGHLIRDQTDYLPYKGEVLKDQDREAFYAGVAEALTDYLAGVRSGDLAKWHGKWPFLRGKTDEMVLAKVLRGRVRMREVWAAMDTGRNRIPAVRPIYPGETIA